MNYGAYRAFNPTWHSEDSPWKARKIAAVLKGRFPETPPSAMLRVADIGCGAGLILKSVVTLLRENGIAAEGHGFDVSPDALNDARTVFPGGQFHLVTSNELVSSLRAAAQNRKFDLTLMIDILEHLDRPEDLLRAVSSLTRYAVTHIPLEDNLEVRARGLRRRFRERVGHIQHYSATAARSLLTANGFVIRAELPTCLDYDADYIFTSRARRLIAQPVRRLFFKHMPYFTAAALGNVSLMSFLEAQPHED